MLVQEIMTKNVVDIGCNDLVVDACKKFASMKVGSLVVMDKDMIVGIITERDIIQEIVLVNGDPKKTKVMKIMSPNIKTIHAMAPVEKAADIMKEHSIKKLQVVLNNEIVGIVTENDLSRTIHAFSNAIDELTQFYENSRENMEKMMDDWGDLLVSLRNYKKLPEPPNTGLTKEIV